MSDAAQSKEPDQVLLGSTAGTEKIPLDSKPVPVFFWAGRGFNQEYAHSAAAARAALVRWAGNPLIETMPILAGECKALFYVPMLCGVLPPNLVKLTRVFFDRDGREAMVFEWDRHSEIFRGREAEWFANPNRLSLV